MHDVFDKKYKSLNKAQKEAVDTIYGPLMVVAGPGTGKTTLLTLRIANILKQTDTRPEQILALTFTESGAKAMKDKLREIIGSDALKVNIFTYHSFAERIIHNFSDYFGEFLNFRFLGEDEALILIEDIIDKGSFEHITSVTSPFSYVGKIISYIQNLKKEFISPERLLSFLKDYEESLRADESNYSSRGKTKGNLKSGPLAIIHAIEKTREVAEVYRLYNERKIKDKRYDFDDVINQVITKVATNENLRFEIVESYQFILADEHQDANESQNKILDMFNIGPDSPNIMVVGDEKQAIFRFQGATLAHFTGFKDRYPDAKLITLFANYRSHQNILDYSFALWDKSSDKLLSKEKLSSETSHTQGKIEFHSFFDKPSEVAYIAEEIKRIVDTDEDNVAVIFRTNKEKDSIARALDTLGVGYASENNNELFENKYAEEIVALIDTLSNFENSPSLGRALCSSIFNIGIEEAQKVFKQSNKERVPLINIIKESQEPKIQAVYSRLLSLGDTALRERPSVFVEQIARETEFLKNLDASVLSSKLEILRSFAHIARTLEERNSKARLFELKAFIDKALEYNVKISVPTSDTGVQVRLMTAHKSKGLEFDYVFVVNLTDGDWGSKESRGDGLVSLGELVRLSNDGSVLEDSRKLLYVAMTRARKHLIFTFPRFKSDGKENNITGFLDEMPKELCEMHVHEEKTDFEFRHHEIKKKRSDFFRQLFLSESFSVTALNNYLECPNKYLFNNLLRFPFAMNIHLEVGNALHRALDVFHTQILHKKPHNGALLFEMFVLELKKSNLGTKERLEIEAEYKDSVVDLGDHFNQSDDTLLKSEYPLYDDYEFVFNNETVSIAIRGSVDRVDEKDGEYYVTDFKTGKPKTLNEITGQTAKEDTSYLRQIIFYKMIMERMDGKVSVPKGQVYFVKRKDNGDRVFFEFDLKAHDVEHLKGEMESAWKEILSGEFLTLGCEKKDCEFCALRKSLDI